MDPISIGLLSALAGGAGGEMGKGAWAALVALVRRPFNREGGSPPRPDTSSGEIEVLALQKQPDDAGLAHKLSTVLAVRAALDADFAAALSTWRDQAALYNAAADRSVTNTISGGTYHGPVLMGRTLSNIDVARPSGQPDHPPAQEWPQAGDG